MTTDVIFTEEKHLGLITLNRPQALHALTLSMIMAIQHQLEAWKKSKHIHAVIIQATPGKAFCAGGDVRWLYDMGLTDRSQQMQFFEHEYRLNQFIHDYPKPYIALMNGITMGGGVGISLHGSHAVASERFSFAMPETTIGFFPDIGASYLLARCPDSTGIYLGLTGNRIHAGDAYNLNLVGYTIASHDFEQVLHRLLEADLSENPYERVSDCLQPFHVEMPTALKCNLIAHHFKPKIIEAIFSGLAEAKDPWCHEILANLQQKSPLSLKVTLLQLHQAKSRSLAECLQMDHCLVKHFMQDHDFYEGVRALLVDKDKSPRWQPSYLTEVTEQQVRKYFS